MVVTPLAWAHSEKTHEAEPSPAQPGLFDLLPLFKERKKYIFALSVSELSVSLLDFKYCSTPEYSFSVLLTSQSLTNNKQGEDLTFHEASTTT